MYYSQNSTGIIKQKSLKQFLKEENAFIDDSNCSQDLHRSYYDKVNWGHYAQ